MKNQRLHKPYETFKRTLSIMGLRYEDVAKAIGSTAATVQLKVDGYSDFYISEQRAISEQFGIGAEVFFADLKLTA